jgi:hypothetical protein
MGYPHRHPPPLPPSTCAGVECEHTTRSSCIHSFIHSTRPAPHSRTDARKTIMPSTMQADCNIASTHPAARCHCVCSTSNSPNLFWKSYTSLTESFSLPLSSSFVLSCNNQH